MCFRKTIGIPVWNSTPIALHFARHCNIDSQALSVGRKEFAADAHCS